MCRAISPHLSTVHIGVLETGGAVQGRSWALDGEARQRVPLLKALHLFSCMLTHHKSVMMSHPAYAPPRQNI